MSVDPARHNFKIYPGATFHEPITYLTGDVGSAPKDLTGATATMVLKDKPQGTTLLTLDNGVNGGLTLGGSSGIINVILSASATAALSWTSAVYELFLTDGTTNETDLILTGGFLVQTF